MLPGEFDFVLPETNWISAGLTLLLALGSRVAKQQGIRTMKDLHYLSHCIIASSDRTSRLWCPKYLLASSEPYGPSLLAPAT